MNQELKADAGQYLTFELRNQLFGVPIASVREINRLSEITPVPHTPEFMAGVINLREKVIPVVNLRQKFGYEKAEATRHSCIIVFEGTNLLTGAIVDAVRGVINLDAHQIETSPVNHESGNASYVIGMGKIEQGLVVLVDAAASLSSDDLSNFVSEVASKAA